MATVTRTAVPAHAADLQASAETDRVVVPAPSRPRLLSYVGRWGRARRWLPADARLVLDVGSAFGYGTAALAGRGRDGRRVIGVERDATHLAAARRLFPWIAMVQADAVNLPFAEGEADAAVLLDVLEHVAEPSAVIEELHRVLRPGGTLVVSVPHRGLLAALDANNVSTALRRRFRWWPPLEAAEESAGGVHRHYSDAELRAVLGPWFVVERAAHTGIGLAEVLNLAGVLVAKVVLRSSRPLPVLRLVHLLIYVVDDLVPAGRWGYHLTVQARAVEGGTT